MGLVYNLPCETSKGHMHTYARKGKLPLFERLGGQETTREKKNGSNEKGREVIHS
jgi:hypothetical protein